MKIWITEIGEPLPMEKDVRLHRYGQFTKFLAQAGHEVVWWTSSFSHAPKKHFAEKDQDIIIDGVTIRVIRGLGYPRNISFQRINHQRDFAKRFYEWAKGLPKPDLIISPIPTIETAEQAVRLGREMGVPVLTDVRDQWPDEMRDLAPKPLRWFAELLLQGAYKRMQYVCQNVDGIMGISQNDINFGLRFSKRDPGPNDCFFPLGYSNQEGSLEKLHLGEQWCRQIGLRPEAFICCFFGTIGKYFDLSTVIKAARILEKEFDIQFVFGGDGSSQQRFKREAEGVKSVFFPGWLDRPKIEAVMKMSKAGLAPYALEAKMSLPNKPFEYMAGSLPLVSSIQGQLKSMLEKHQCGFTYRADSVEQLCEILRTLHRDPALQVEMGRRARALLESEFSTEQVFARVNQHLIKVVESGKALGKGVGPSLAREASTH